MARYSRKMNNADIVQLRREGITLAGYRIAKERGLAYVTRDEVSAAAECSAPLINYYFGNVRLLRGEIIRYAIEQGDHDLVNEGRMLRDPIALAYN